MVSEVPNMNSSLEFNEIFNNENFHESEESKNDNLLQDTNNLLQAVGISAKRIDSIDELSRVASSMFVAIFESFFRIRLENICRNPQNKEDYIKNAQYVIDGLSEQIQFDLLHISGASIVEGDLHSISNLVNIFSRILVITK